MIIAVHLAGNPCRITELRAIADEFKLLLIEDCAQAWGACCNNKNVGLFGHAACYSLNDFKHLSCGDGGIVASSDPQIGPLLQRYGDKAYDRTCSDRISAFLAPNYRISEPQSAIAAAQLDRLEFITRRRNELGTRLGNYLLNLPGVFPHQINEHDLSSYWFYLFRIDQNILCSRDQFTSALKAEGVSARSGYISKPLYRYDVFQNHNFFAGEWPIRSMGLTQMDYRQVSCPTTEAVLQSCIYIEIHEDMDYSYIDRVASAIRKVAGYYNNHAETLSSPT